MQLFHLQKHFPIRMTTTNAVTGWIPMQFFNGHRQEIKEIVKQHELRMRYRGPRFDRTKATAWKRNAHSVILYTK